MPELLNLCDSVILAENFRFGFRAKKSWRGVRGRNLARIIPDFQASKDEHMSFEQKYFPPNKTKWEWGAKQLTYSGWVCDLSCQKEKGLWLWPLSVILYVDLVDGRFCWCVKVHTFKRERYDIDGSCKDPLRACRTAEKIGERELKKLIPKWVRTALKNGWRSPAQTTF